MALERTSMGWLARLVDDAIVQILCFCNIIEILHIEQTCRYLRSLAQHREIWLAVLLRLPPELTPGVLPNQRREDCDFRSLALRALRGYKNWTSEKPRPLFQQKLRLKHSERNLTDPRLLPGGRFLLYILDNVLYFFDIRQDKYILEWRITSQDYFNSTYQLLPDKNVVRICLVGQLSIEGAICFRFSLLELDIATGNCELFGAVTASWSDLCSTVRMAYIMLHSPSLNDRRTMIPYRAGNYSDENHTGGQSRGAIIIDFNDRSLKILSLQCCDETETDIVSPINFANNHLLYVSGRGSPNLTIRSVPLALLENWHEGSSDVNGFPRYDILPEHANCHWRIHTPEQTPPRFCHIFVYDPNWIDLHKARLTDPATASLSLVDVSVIWTGGVLDHELSMTLYCLQFVELYDGVDQLSNARTKPLATFRLDDEATVSAGIGFRNNWLRGFRSLCRNGRMYISIEAGDLPANTSYHGPIATLVNGSSFRPLGHLTGKRMLNFDMDYYTGIALHSSQLRDPVTKQPIPNSGEDVLEDYDGHLPHLWS